MNLLIITLLCCSLFSFCVSCDTKNTLPQLDGSRHSFVIDPLATNDYLNTILIDVDSDGIFEIITAHENVLEFYNEQSKLHWKIEQARSIDLYLSGIWRGKRVFATGYADYGQLNLELYDTSGLSVWFAGIKIHGQTRYVVERPKVLAVSDINGDGLTEIIAFVPSWQDDQPGKIFCFGETGRLLWEIKVIGLPTDFTVAHDETGENLLLFGFNHDESYSGSATQSINAPAIALNDQGELLWQFMPDAKNMGAGIGLCSNIDNRPTVCASLYPMPRGTQGEGGIFRLDTAGNILNSFTEAGAIVDLIVGPDTAQSPVLYAASASGTVFLLAADFEIKASIKIESGKNPPAINFVGLADYTGDLTNELLLYSSYHLENKTHDYDYSGPDYQLSFSLIVKAIRNKILGEISQTPQTVLTTTYCILSNDLQKVIARENREQNWHKRKEHQLLNIIGTKRSPQPFANLYKKLRIFSPPK
jgi:uncharacterized membrane protein